MAGIPSPYRLAVFDLDGALAPSWSPIGAPVAGILTILARHMQVCVISSGRFEEFDERVLGVLTAPETLRSLHLMPTYGTRYLASDGDTWAEVYSEPLTSELDARARHELESAAHALRSWQPDDRLRGPRIESCGAQVTLSVLGRAASPADRQRWDPTGTRTESLRLYAQQRLPHLEVRSSGPASVEVTRRNVDKAYGVRRLLAHLSLTPADAIFFGDRLHKGGDDHPVLATGVRCVPVDDWRHTPREVCLAIMLTPTPSDGGANRQWALPA